MYARFCTWHGTYSNKPEPGPCLPGCYCLLAKCRYPGSPSVTISSRTLEWVAISFSNAWKWKVKVKSLSRVRLLVTPGTAAHQAPSSMGFFQARVLEWGVIAFSNSWLHNSWRLEFRFIKGLRVFCYFLTHSRHDYIVMFLAFHFPFEENFTFWSLWK